MFQSLHPSGKIKATTTTTKKDTGEMENTESSVWKQQWGVIRWPSSSSPLQRLGWWSS